jgi:hypothetical protein
MSTTMDLQDLRGALRGICLITVARTTGGAFTAGDIERALRGTFAPDLAAAVVALSSYAGVDEGMLTSVVPELLRADDEFLKADNINLQLGLLAGQPLPIFSFMKTGETNLVALVLPFIETARNLVHAAVRLRMQSLPVTDPAPFWPAIVRFLERMGGGDDMAHAIALSTVAGMISDVIFFNAGAPGRTNDPVLAAGIERVLVELSSSAFRLSATTRGSIP